MHSDLFQMNAMRARFYVNEPINVNGNDVQWFEINLVEMHNDEHDYEGFKYSIACMNKLGSYVNVITGEPDSDGTGKAGLTFQAISSYNIESSMNTTRSNSGGWRDTILRKNLNDESTGIIWNAIQSTDFKNNITPVLKITNNNYSNKNTSNASNITVDKLYILSPSEMGMPIMRNYYNIYSYNEYQRNANMHYYDLDSYNNTIKSSGDGNNHYWFTALDYIYAGDAYQWWMLPAGSRKMNNGNHAYHNTDSYSYCAVAIGTNPSSKNSNHDAAFWLRSPRDSSFFAHFNCYYGDIDNGASYDGNGVVPAFSF